MAERIRNSEWENDEALRKDLEKHVRQNLRRNEILDFVKLDYPMYAWSIRSLGRRLQLFGIKYTDYEVDVGEVQRAVNKELQGPGMLLGYRAMQQKVREVHGLNVPRDLVYAVMGEADPQGLEARGGVGKSNRPRRTNAFVTGVSSRLASSLRSVIQTFYVIRSPPTIVELLWITFHAAPCNEAKFNLSDFPLFPLIRH